MRYATRSLQAVAAGLVLFAVAACDGSFYLDLAALNQDPSVAKPSVQSFVIEREIHVEWPEDRATDTYVLYRDDVSDPVQPTIIYEGTDLSFIDRDVTVGRFYYYRLGKRRGQKLFEPSDPVIAVGSDVRADEWEPNDVKDQAVTFRDGMLGNIYAYRDGEGRRVVDVDYYKVTLPARTRLTIQVNGLSQFESNDLSFALEHKAPQPLNSGDEAPIVNEAMIEQTFAFRIIVNEENFFGDTGSGKSGGNIGSYVLDLVTITPL